ncbi:glycosyltransferase family 4 protein [Methylomarinovum tepidoasis]|nr:glycosyltransferase family 4 protein [Methylomarinovum sp. IN45]
MFLRPRILLFGRDPAWFGGVVNFLAALQKETKKTVEYYNFTIGQRPGNPLPISKYLTPLVDAICLTTLIFRERFDSYHVNPSLNPASLIRDGLFLLILRCFKARNVVVSFHGWEPSTARAIENNHLSRFLFRTVFGWPDHILVLADSFRDWLVAQGLPAERIHRFTTMFDGDEAKSAVDSTDPSGDTIRLLYLSRIIREKGIFELVEAFSTLSREDGRLELVIAGTGSEENVVRQRVVELGLEGRVRFPGYCRGGDKWKLIYSSDIFLLPSSYGEGCPVSLLEAMAAGLPVITTPVGGIPHIVEDGKHGFLLAEVTPWHIADGIRRLVTDSQLRKRMGELNRKEAWEKYEAEKVARRFERLYRGEGWS